ncbi:hypothetical protein TrST_g1017 [Triparma strigata]|uniref:Thioredoxin domain-containing protein n=1 Tax=Triparma strigata TaxID=1606541 RepID=A0A9W6ZSB5_9STRA|nr:hypothetical protein TrST_g1017 [Triparma strigata]
MRLQARNEVTSVIIDGSELRYLFPENPQARYAKLEFIEDEDSNQIMPSRGSSLNPFPGKSRDVSLIPPALLIASVLNFVNGRYGGGKGGTVAIVGGNWYSEMLAEGMLHCLSSEAKVYLISSKAAAPLKEVEGGPELTIINVNDEEKRFVDIIGDFDVLLDCVGDEGEMREADEYGVLAQLRNDFNLGTYISTQTAGQKMVVDGGVWNGGQEAKQYTQEVVDARPTSPETLTSRAFLSTYNGNTFQTVMEKLRKNGVKSKATFKNGVYYRGSDLQLLWEGTTWPRDSEGVNVRFGFPVPKDLGAKRGVRWDAGGGAEGKEEEEGEEDIEVAEEEEEEEEEREFDVGVPEVDIANKPTSSSATKLPTPKTAAAANVKTVKNMDDMRGEILDAEKSAVLFLSAPFCKTCKYLAPQYSRMAKLTESAGGGVDFVKISVVGDEAKEVSRWLGVEAVPTFVFFKEGQRIGEPVTTTKLNKKSKVQKGVNILAKGGEGFEWDLEDDD